MAYSLYICRPAEDAEGEPTPIPLEEWCAAVAATEGVRLLGGKVHTFRIPTTNQVLTIGAHEGDAEVFFPDDGEWHPVFRWFEGSASFVARLTPGDTAHPVWAATVSLATRLGAVNPRRGRRDIRFPDRTSDQVLGAAAKLLSHGVRLGAAMLMVDAERRVQSSYLVVILTEFLRRPEISRCPKARERRIW